MLISAHEQNNMYYYEGNSASWALGWTSQQLVSASEETVTGGTYE